jgi:hypothetical protein
MHETSGVLKPVIRRYLQGHTLDPSDIRLMRLYLEQWFDSPVWMLPGDSEGLAELESMREKVRSIKSTEEIREVLKDALDWGIDPP